MPRVLVSPKFDADFETSRACHEIDDGFEFLCKLYHCKYRGKHRKMTRFSEWSSKINDPAEAVFVHNITDLVDRDSKCSSSYCFGSD